MILKTVQFLLHDHENSNNIIVGFDNFYTTPDVINYLNKNQIGFVGTIRQNRNIIPNELKNLKLGLHESINVSNNNIVLVNYHAKKDKNVYFISNCINNFRVCKGNKKKPEVALLYNRTKGATDRFDQLITKCDLRRKANRFQLAVLYDILNIIVTNAFIVQRMFHGDKLKHQQFVFDLSLKIMGVNTQYNKTKVCSFFFKEEEFCKSNDVCFAIRKDYPRGKVHIGNNNCFICNSCGNPINTKKHHKVSFYFCDDCFDEMNLN